MSAREIQGLLEQVADRSSASFFLTKLSTIMRYDPEIQYREASNFVDAAAAVIEEISDVSRSMEPETCKAICKVFYHASLYE